MGVFPVEDPAQVETVNGIGWDQEMGRVAAKETLEETLRQLTVTDSRPPVKMSEAGMDEQWSAVGNADMVKKILEHVPFRS
jgi:cell division GTPase FtsZ